MTDETRRVTVSTYVPAHQHERWREDADRLGMSQSEFVRSMVQAGRRGFALEGGSESTVDADVTGSNPGGNDLRTALLELLRDRGPLDWDDIVDELTGDVEAEVERALQTLQDAQRIQHSPRRGTYRIVEPVDGE